MKANTDKCHLLVSRNERCIAKIEEFSIKNSTKEKLLGVKFDSNLYFENHITSLCKKASQKLHALARISHYMDLTQEPNESFHNLSVAPIGMFWDELLPPYMDVSQSQLKQ